MSSLNQFTQKIWKSIVDLFEVSAPARAQATRRATTSNQPEPAAPEADPAPVGQTLRLEKSQTSFLVMCASCTSLHELDVVCPAAERRSARIPVTAGFPCGCPGWAARFLSARFAVIFSAHP